MDLKIHEQKKSDLKSFQTVVQSGFQSYSAAVSKTCTTALALKRIDCPEKTSDCNEDNFRENERKAVSERIP